jgi:glycosyltransferase involved in cell wall biosynthesis
LPEVAGNAAILVPPSEPLRHVEAIATIVENDATHRDLRERGLARARQFTWAASAAQLLNHFRSLL